MLFVWFHERYNHFGVNEYNWYSRNIPKEELLDGQNEFHLAGAVQKLENQIIAPNKKPLQISLTLP